MICTGNVFVLHALCPGHRLGGLYESQSPKLSLCMTKAEVSSRMQQQTQAFLPLAPAGCQGQDGGWQWVRWAPSFAVFHHVRMGRLTQALLHVGFRATKSHGIISL